MSTDDLFDVPAQAPAAAANPSADGPRRRRRNRFRLAAVAVLALMLSLVAPGVSHAGGVWQGTYGAGQNAPSYNDGIARWWYSCVPDQAVFKVTRASIYVWSKGKDRVKGAEFKYRLVARGTDGQIQWWSNWSKTAKYKTKKNKKFKGWLNATGLGQSFSSASSWDMEINLKYPRSLRKAYSKKYRVHVPSPQCGPLAND